MSTITKEAVLKALSRVDDPDLKKDLITLGMIQDVSIDSNKISYTLMLTTPACPLKNHLENMCVTALKEDFGDSIEVNINFDSQVSSMRSDNQQIMKGVRNIIGVASGKGGVGKSTIAVNLAIALEKFGAKTGLLDADIHGPSLPMMLGLRDRKPHATEAEGKLNIIPEKCFGIKTMSMGMLVDERQPMIWRGPMLASALNQLMIDVDWGDLDYLIIDLPPGTGDIHLSLAQQFPLNGIVVVTTPQQVSLADNRKTIEMFINQQINIPVLGIVENMSWFSPEELPDNKYFIFGKDGGKILAGEYQIPLLGQIPIIMSVCEDADTGKPAVLSENKQTRRYFMDVAGNLAQQIAKLSLIKA